MSPETEQAEEREYTIRQGTVPLSWRDVGKMVAESEARLTKSIDQWGERVTGVLSDHETRIKAEENFTVGAKASGNTAEKFFSFGKWVVMLLVGVCALIVSILIYVSANPSVMNMVKNS